MGEFVEDAGSEVVDDAQTLRALWAGRSSPCAHVVSGAVAPAAAQQVLQAALTGRQQPPPGLTPGEGAWAAVVAACALHGPLADWPWRVLAAGLSGPQVGLAMARQV
jgi:hypothetical protein